MVVVSDTLRHPVWFWLRSFDGGTFLSGSVPWMLCWGVGSGIFTNDRAGGWVAMRCSIILPCMHVDIIKDITNVELDLLLLLVLMLMLDLVPVVHRRIP